ncbi:MAG TPA: hypothetical protein VFM50_04660 [Nocardioidaceae bacterium]|nr:hypothetical protein [Nocardioidaceae bacterium]
MTPLAILCAALAAALLVPGPAVTRPRGMPTAGGRGEGSGAGGAGSAAGAAGAAGAAPQRGRGRRALLLLLLPALGLTFATVLHGRALVLGLIGLVALFAGARLLASARGRKRAAEREEKVVEVCEVLVAELRAGQPPSLAVEHCAEVWPDLAPAATAARLGADLPTAFRRLSRTPGCAGLRHVAAAFEVSQGTGAGLTVALGQVATSARETRGTRRLVASELASAQATAWMVSGLPVLTLVLGVGIGGDPVGFLVESSAGIGCLAVGLGLTLLGLWWLERIAAGVTSS